MFQTKWNSLERARSAEMDHSDLLNTLSPLSKDGIWGRVITALGAIGLAAPLQSAIKTQLSNSSLVWLSAGAAAITLSFLTLIVILHLLRIGQLQRIEASFPENVMRAWGAQAQNDYRQLIVQFAREVVGITARLYPDFDSTELDDSALVAIANKHLSLGADYRKEDTPHAK
jgi:hypothetical protein